MKKILKEIEVKTPNYVTKLENGTVLLVYDGYAQGNDGKNYFCVERETAEDEYELIGWQCEEL